MLGHFPFPSSNFCAIKNELRKFCQCVVGPLFFLPCPPNKCCRSASFFKILNCTTPSPTLTLSYLGGGGGQIRPLLLHHPKMAQGIELKLSDFKDTPLRHILQVKPVRYVLRCNHGDKITEGTSQDLAPKKSEKSAICKDIELKFGIETKLGPLSSKTNINLQFDVIMTFLAFRTFR